METRTEKDSLGEMAIPSDAYYGIQTARALDNFPISGLRPRPAYVDATVQIKRAAAIVNAQLGLLPADKAEAIVRAADEILAGRYQEWFVVDVYQAGAGTSHNMNVNEVLANRAAEILGGRRGDYSLVHPNDHVNMSQSTNDVCPTAIRIGALMLVRLLLGELEKAAQTLDRKAKEFDGVIKSGRTHLTDAVPIRLGQEFGAWGTNLGKHHAAVQHAADSCLELGIGGTAAGTGLNAHPEYRAKMVAQLFQQLSMDFRPAENYFEAMQSLRPMVELSGAVRNLAQDLIRISNDIRLLASGPKTGLAEINLRPLQPGSSIMPGKVNPVIFEMMDMVCFQVIGCDATVLMAAQAGQLELNVMMPVVAFNLLHEIGILANALKVWDSLGIAGITVNEQRCRMYAEESLSTVTVLNPHIGYQRGAELAKESLRTGKPLRELVLERGLLSREKLDEIFDLRKMTEPGIHK